jgi:hypothetical protein
MDVKEIVACLKEALEQIPEEQRPAVMAAFVIAWGTRVGRHIVNAEFEEMIRDESLRTPSARKCAHDWEALDAAYRCARCGATT